MNFGKKQRDMSHSSSSPKAREKAAPTVSWSNRHGFQAFGDRLNFLSPEAQHLNTGRLRVLPPLNPEKRNGRQQTD